MQESIMEERRSEERLMADKNSDEIKELILETPDAKDKAILLILLKISDDLYRNTQITASLSDKFEKHVESFVKHAEEEMSLINQGRGFLRAFVIFLGILQAIVLFLFSEHMQDFKKLSDEVNNLREYKAEHIAHHKEERETYKAWVKTDGK
jgi:hypothetical protein